MKINYTKLSYEEMAAIVKNISEETKNRNPLFVNSYMQDFYEVVNILRYFHERKQESPGFDEQ